MTSPNHAAHRLTLLGTLFTLAAGFGSLPASEVAQWSLDTADTSLHLEVVDNHILIDGLQNPVQKWNWVPVPSLIPLPCAYNGSSGVAHRRLEWIYAGVREDLSTGHTVILTFNCASPRLELKSFWHAQSGPGPVENWMTIKNTSTEVVAYGPELVGGCAQLRADHEVIVHSFDKTANGSGKVHSSALTAQTNLSTSADQIPFLVFDVGSKHGLYLGFEWELGGFLVATSGNPLAVTATVNPLNDAVNHRPGSVFVVPSVYYGTYQGDLDDGSNRFRKWFWDNKITRSLHDHADEPWTEVCMQELGGNGSAGVTGKTPQSGYDKLAATGVELVKLDFWDGTGKCWYTDRDWTFRADTWPQGFDYAAKAHQAGLKASLYMGGTFNDADLTTIAGRDAELEAVHERFNKGWFDMWRTDFYTAPREPMPQTYDGVADFMYIQDKLIADNPGYRYENCCNGGKYKGFAICRRMTFCTMNDIDNSPVATRSTYYSNSFAISPTQLKSDLGPADKAYYLRTDMLGAILTWAVDTPLYRQHIALYKSRQRPILRGGNVYHILPMADGINWDGLEFFNPGINKGSVFLFKPSAKASDGDTKVIRLKGLDRKTVYVLNFQDRIQLNATRTGAELMDQGIAVSGMTGDEASEIIWINP